MTLKVCFNNQIHKITKLPANYSTLLHKVSEVFGSQLPQNWTLQYLDYDNDRIMLKNQEDYENFLEEQQVYDSKKTVKIFVLTYEDIQNNTDLSSSAASESFEETMNEETQSPSGFESPNSTYIEGPQDRVEIEEEIIEKPQPEPFDERLGGLIQERFATPVKEEEQPKRVVIEKTHQQKPKPQPQQPKKTPQAQPQAKAQENKPKAAQPSAERQQQQPKRNAPRDIFSDLFGGFGEQASVSTPRNRAQQAQETSRPKPRQQAQRAQPTVHREVQCNGCGMYPLTGIRYKCYECPNFDFCERCESTRYHPHEFMQFIKPEPERTHQYHGNRNDQYYGGRNSAYGRQPQYSQYRDVPHDPFGFSQFASPRMSESYRPRTQQTPRRSDFGFFPMFI